MHTDVYGTEQEARKHEAGPKRVYRVHDGSTTLYVVALSPRHAIGQAGPHFHLKAELLGPPVVIDDLVNAMSPEQRKALLERLNAVT